MKTVQDIARSASDRSRAAAIDHSHGRQAVVLLQQSEMSTVGAKDSLHSFATPWLPSQNNTLHGLAPVAKLYRRSAAQGRGFCRDIISRALAALAVLFCWCTAAVAQNPDSILTQIGIDQKLGSQIDLNLEFHDETGQTVKLGNYIGTKPVILTPVYYECPMLCSMLLNGLVKALRVMPFASGKEFEIVTFSIDPNEAPTLAAEKKSHYVRDYGRPQAAVGWHFLTGDTESIRKLANEIGFRFTYDTYTKQWAHTSGIVVLTPGGLVSQYFYGIEFDPNDLKLSLIQASNQKLGSVTDHILLYCFQYNPTTGKYSIAITRVLRAFAVVTVLVVAGFIFIESRRKRFA
jgi:protein SCO1/2